MSKKFTAEEIFEFRRATDESIGKKDVLQMMESYAAQQVAAALAETKPQTEDPEKVRREIATAAMQGLLGNADTLREFRKESGDNWDKYNLIVSGMALNFADALIAELAKKKGGDNE